MIRKKNYMHKTQSMKSNYFKVLLYLLTSISTINLLAGSKANESHSPLYLAELACNNFVQISLDTNCYATVTLPMLLEDQLFPTSEYTIQLWTGDVLQADLDLGTSDKGKTYTFKVIHNTTGNSCWGKIKIEDKLAPTILCSKDTIRCGDNIAPEELGFPIPSYYKVKIDVCSNQNNCYIVNDWDACSTVILTYHDENIDFPCDSAYSKLIKRCWTATDLSGNTSSCCDSIFIIKANFSDLTLPPDFDGVVRPHIYCGDSYPKLANGNPDPSYTGWPVPAGCNRLTATYSDLKIVICENTYKILRRWVILDWCTKAIYEHNQLIKVVDDLAPQFDVPDNVFVGMKNYTCGSFGKLPIPSNVQDCGSWNYNVYSRVIDLLGNPTPLTKDYIRYNNNEKVYYLDGAPEGRIWIFYEVYDDCGNVSSQQIEVGVVDEFLPIPICDEKTVVTLTNDGTARVLAETFDNGSIDNCGIYDFKVRRMDDPCKNGTNVFGDYVDFCCTDVGKSVMVNLLVIDNSRNTNSCMVEIVVQEKEPPVIIAPTDITISCSYDISDLSKFGSIRYSETDRKKIQINDYYYQTKGYDAGIDGLATDNCFVEVSEIVNKNLTCNQGVITRTFIAKDKQGLTSTATQYIYVQNPYPFTLNDIKWPVDKTIYSCRKADIHPGITGSPEYVNTNCATLAANYEDQLLSKVDSSCYKIFRKWTVVDWCQFNAQSNAGVWTRTQILYVINTVPPDIYTCGTTEVCDYNSYYDPAKNACMVHYDITGDADDDCTYKEFLKWSYRLDTNNDGNYEGLVSGNRVLGVLPVGQFKIRWYVEDACGNVSSCDQLVLLKDCKKPTPYCINGITTVIMPLNGSITVWAKDLDFGSYDNCTSKQNLIFSFSSDIRETSIRYTCDSLNGQISIIKKVRIYVTDESGNQDYCETSIKIQDNNKVCGGTFVNVNGLISRKDGKSIPNALVNIENDKQEKISSTLTDLEGKYSFQTISLNNTYKVSVEREDDILNGISTYDIVLIQRHILGKTSFSSPFEILAADVNNSQSITARDISDLRKVILGVTDKFPSEKIWTFVNSKTNFSDVSNPWDAKGEIEFKDLIEDFSHLDFVGVKKGDVDNSATLNKVQTPKTRTSSILWNIGEPMPNNGHFLYPVISTVGMTMEGFQTALKGNGIVSIVSGAVPFEDWNYNNQKGILSISWNAPNAIVISENTVLFYIETETNQMQWEQVEASRFTHEIYLNDVVSNLILSRNSNIGGDYSMKLGQNEPNPFQENTIIPIEVNVASTIYFSVFDVSGKLIFAKTIGLHVGKNYIQVDHSNLLGEGIYFYKVEGNKGTEVRKMILKY